MGVCYCTGACRELGRCPNNTGIPAGGYWPTPQPLRPGLPTITPLPAPSGWVCPVCGRGVSPYASSCPNCQPPLTITYTTAKSDTPPATIPHDEDRCLSQCGPDFCSGWCTE